MLKPSSVRLGYDIFGHWCQRFTNMFSGGLGRQDTGKNPGGPVWYENLSGVVSCPENSKINTDGLDSVVIGSRDQ